MSRDNATGRLAGSQALLTGLRKNIPAELRSLPHWVMWKTETREAGKPTKVPYDAKADRRASSTNPDTWCSFEDACAAYEKGGFDGVGFVLTKNDPFVGIDLDKCRDPETGEIQPWAKRIFD